MALMRETIMNCYKKQANQTMWTKSKGYNETFHMPKSCPYQLEMKLQDDQDESDWIERECQEFEKENEQ